MARIRKQIQSLNLYKYDVLIEDAGPRSDYFKITQFDGYFYGGRNAFLVAGTTTLKPNSKILVEILNANGDTVFSAPVANFIEGNSRLVQVEVYEDTPPGPGKLVILGCTETYLDGTPVPPTWMEKYNVRWITDVIISPRINNKTPIRFINQPAVTVSEKFYSAPATSSLLQTSSVLANFELTPVNYNIFQNGYLISLLNANETNKFTADYIGGTLNTVISFPDRPEFVSASIPITKVLNSTIAESGGTIITSSIGTKITTAVLSASSDFYTTRIEPYGTTLITSSQPLIKYNKVIESLNTSSISSFAKIVVSNLNTLSGEVNKVRISYKPTTEPGEYVLLGDVRTNVQELLAVDGVKNIIEYGKFKDVTVDDYWYAATMSVSTDDRVSTLPAYYLSSSLYTNLVPVKTSDILLDAIRATPDIIGGAFKNDESYFIGTTKNANIQLFPNSEYTLKLTAVAARASASIALQQSNYLAEVYLVSSEQTTNTTLLNQTNKGQLIATLQLNAQAEKQLFENVEFNFTPKITQAGTFGVRIVVYGGFWNFSNISLKPAEEKFFNPDEISLLIPNINFSRKLLTFKTDFLDINNNSIGVSALSTPVFFIGTSTVASRGGASVSISTSPPLGAFPGDLWWNSEEGQLKIYYSDGDSLQWVDASGEYIETGSMGGGIVVSSSYAVTASYALNGGGGGGGVIISGSIDTGSFATTGSNIFFGNQTINGIVNFPTNPELIGPKVSFAKANYSSSQQDVLTSGSMVLARANNQGLYNAALEPSYTSNTVSPSGSLWNSIFTDPKNYGWSNLQSLPYRTYDSWTAAVNYWAGIYMVDLPMAMKDTINDKYYLIKFKQWTTGSQGGGFAYDRYEVTLPPKITFSRPNNSPNTVDTISSEVIIKRDNNQGGIYNTVREAYYEQNEYQSPLGTRWNSSYTDPDKNGWSDLSNVRSRKYDSWREAVGRNPSGSIGKELVMHDVRSDKYWMIKFTNWQSGGNGGGFSYERTEIKLDPGIQFPNGKTQTIPFLPEELDRTAVIGTIFDRGEDALQVGDKIDMYIPFSASIQSWTLLADQPGNLVVDIWKSNYSSYPPTSASSIISTEWAKPLLSSAVKNKSYSISYPWNKQINPDDTLTFYIQSNDVIQRLNLTLVVSRNASGPPY